MIETVDVNSIGATNNVQGKSELGKDDFLKLMIEQLKNQDPLDPMDGADYTAQLAQFSSLEQLKNMSSSLDQSVLANLQLTQSVNNTMTASLIGKEVKLSGKTIEFNGQESAQLGYNLLGEAEEVTLKIYDESGKLVKSFEDLDGTEGEHELSWDFTDNNGKKVDESNFTFEVEATSSSGDDIIVEQYNIGLIDAIRFTEYGAVVVVNDVQYGLSDISEIVNPKENETS